MLSNIAAANAHEQLDQPGLQQGDTKRSRRNLLKFGASGDEPPDVQGKECCKEHSCYQTVCPVAVRTRGERLGKLSDTERHAYCHQELSTLADRNITDAIGEDKFKLNTK
jgi:hypothetical protein